MRMTSTVEGLRRLHRLHCEREDTQNELAAGPRRIKTAKRATAAKEEQRNSRKEQITSLQKSADEKQLQLRTNEAKITDLKVKLNSAATNREYAIIKSQTEADTVANSVLEDEILEVLEKVDAVRETLRAHDNECAIAREKEEKVAADVNEAEPGHRARVGHLQAAISECENVITGIEAETYRRLVQAHGAGALAAVDLPNNACGACFTTLSPQEGVLINIEKIVFCRACGRLLYRPADDA